MTAAGFVIRTWCLSFSVVSFDSHSLLTNAKFNDWHPQIIMLDARLTLKNSSTEVSCVFSTNQLHCRAAPGA